MRKHISFAISHYLEAGINITKNANTQPEGLLDVVDDPAIRIMQNNHHLKPQEALPVSQISSDVRIRISNYMKKRSLCRKVSVIPKLWQHRISFLSSLYLAWDVYSENHCSSIFNKVFNLINMTGKGSWTQVHMLFRLAQRQLKSTEYCRMQPIDSFYLCIFRFIKHYQRINTV